MVWLITILLCNYQSVFFLGGINQDFIQHLFQIGALLKHYLNYRNRQGINIMKHNNKLITLYGKEYFKGRLGDDIKRQRSFDEEKKFINKYVSMEGSILDVGCSTGEFLKYIKWSGRKYGIEISQFAAEKARQNGINIVNTYDANNSLDVVIYRGTIQHLDSPFRSLEKAVQAL